MSVIFVRMYSYTEVCTFPKVVPQVRTEYVLLFLSMYLVHTRTYCVYKILQGMLFYVVRGCTPVGNDTVCAWHVCSGASTLNQSP